jgi:t-SNARE complex subunit (syntaxin)
VKISWPKTYFFPVSEDFFTKKKYLQQSEQDVLEGLIADTQEAIERNRKTSKKKVGWYRIALWLLIAASVLLILSKLPRFYV